MEITKLKRSLLRRILTKIFRKKPIVLGTDPWEERAKVMAIDIFRGYMSDRHPDVDISNVELRACCARYRYSNRIRVHCLVSEQRYALDMELE